jgi:hypothetical protein
VSCWPISEESNRIEITALERRTEALGDAHAAHYEAERHAQVLLNGHPRQLERGRDREASRRLRHARKYTLGYRPVSTPIA